MRKGSRTTIEVKGSSVTVLSRRDEDYISLTDIAKHKEPDRSDHVIQNWMRNRNTIEFLGVWERLNNPDFNPLEFEGIRSKGELGTVTLFPGDVKAQRGRWPRVTRFRFPVDAVGQR